MNLLLRPYCLGLDVDFDVVSNDQPTGFQHLVPGQAEIAPIDLSRCAESCPLAAPRILGLTFVLYIQSDRLCYAANREITCEFEFLPVTLDMRRPELDLWIHLGVQEIRRTEMLIALICAGIDARCLQAYLDRRLRHVLLIGVDGPFKVRDSALHRRDHQVLGREFDQRVRWVEFPNGFCSYGGSCLYCGHVSSSPVMVVKLSRHIGDQHSRW